MSHRDAVAPVRSIRSRRGSRGAPRLCRELAAAGGLLLAGGAPAAAGPAAGEAPQVGVISPERLRALDPMELEAFNRRDWDRFRSLHCPDVTVTYLGGNRTEGVEAHVRDLRALFAFLPDLRIERRSPAFGAGDLAVIAWEFTGTFTRPWERGPGVPIPPTGRRVRLPGGVMARWRGDCISEKTIVLDSAEFLRQLGVQAGLPELTASTAPPQGAFDFLADAGGFRLRLEPDGRATYAPMGEAGFEAEESVRVGARRLWPGAFLLSWRLASGKATVCLADFEKGRAYGHRWTGSGAAVPWEGPLRPVLP